MGSLSSKYCIVTSVRDEQEFIAQTVRSVVAQTITAREWIIVDDGSTDGTTKVAADYAALQYTRQENSGVSAARNTG